MPVFCETCDVKRLPRPAGGMVFCKKVSFLWLKVTHLPVLYL